MLLVEGLLGLIAFLLGAALFSFMNVVAWRLPRGKNPLTGRSFCPQCGAALTAGDLVPVFSWLFLRGRCRHCRAPIPVRYLLVELLGGVLALGCRWRFGTAYTLGEGLFGMRWQGLLALALCGVLLSIALIDAETQLIPNRLNAAVAVLAVLNLLLSPARWAGALHRHGVHQRANAAALPGDPRRVRRRGHQVNGRCRAVSGLAAYPVGDVFWHFGRRVLRHLSAGRPQGRQKRPLRIWTIPLRPALCWRCFSAIPCLHGTAGFL